MGRYLGPICRLCRREGMKLCDKHKCATLRRNYPPGMHGQDRQGKPSDYSKQLREKQKARRIFGISEKQIQRYYKNAIASKEESGAELIRQFETRFDNVIFRSGFASTRRQARQFVTHRMFNLNGKRVSVPSAQLKAGDIFEVREKSKTNPLFASFAKKKAIQPKWIKTDPIKLQGQVINKPAKEDLEQAIVPQMIIEFYSR
ncbi:MAG: 30S ribosomal protein S4 [Candidatus Gracilibacteria bacterium]